MVDKYSCFVHAKVYDHTLKHLTDQCPECSRPYNFPISDEYLPIKIREYDIISSLSRGYYGATYVAEKVTNIRSKKVTLKIIPIETYKKFNKYFYEECKIHAKAAEDAEHIVDIEDAFEEDVDFRGGITIPCYIAILDYIDGVTSTIPTLPGRVDIDQDIQEYVTWKANFALKLKAFKEAYNYN